VRADRVCSQIMQKLYTFNGDNARIAARKMYRHIQDPVEKKDLTVIKVRDFYTMLDEN
jgi:hypothetical protein